MKVAIVTGGFESIRRQHLIWRTEEQIADAERILLARAEQTAACRSRLRNLQNELRSYGPSKEKK